MFKEGLRAPSAAAGRSSGTSVGPKRASRAGFGLRAAALLCLVPWSLFVLVAGAPMVWRSIGELEAFPETYTSGYFIIKTSAWLLALLVLAQALLDIARRSEAR